MRARRLTALALSTALALALSYAESLIPAPVPIPGVKLGLPNLVIVFALYRYGWREALAVSLARLTLVSLLFPNGAAFLFSLAGAALSFAGMAAMKRAGLFSCLAVSVAGGVLHNAGQLLMASWLMDTDIFRYYFPFLLISGTIAGTAIGAAAAALLRRLPREL